MKSLSYEDVFDRRLYQKTRQATRHTCECLLTTNKEIQEGIFNTYHIDNAVQYIEYLQWLVDAQHEKLLQLAKRKTMPNLENV